MSDMSNTPIETTLSAASAEDRQACFDFIALVVDRLAGDLDEPDVWQILADIPHDDLPLMLAIIADLHPRQADWGVVKKLDLISGMLIATGIDQATGMAMLKQLEADHSLCPQVAGACFFAERFGDPDKSADLSTKFCESPFIKFETLIDGTVAPCCSIWTKKRLGHLERQNFEEIWNSADAVEMRESILDGSFRFCNKQRCTYIMEDALPERDSVTDPDMRAIIDEGRTVLESSPRWLFLAHDITCNLSCPSCRDKLIASDDADEARFRKIEQQVFFPLLNADGEVAISVSGQGDPWSSQHYRSILRYMADHDLTSQLSIHTNALLMSEKRWQDYLGLEKYRPLVDVSIDAATPWVYEIVRRPGKWEKLEPNLRFIAAKHKAGVFREFHINATIQLDNFHEMSALVDFSEELGATSARLYMIQNTGEHIARTYTRNNIGDRAHPLHRAFLETLRDPALGRPVAHLYDVATWRGISFESRLPSDALGADYSNDALHGAMEAAIGRQAFDEVVALCAAGRIRFPDDLDLLRIEARALHLLGYAQQAIYREKMLAARETFPLAA